MEDLGLDALGYDYRQLAEHLATNAGKYQKQLTIKMYGARYPANLDQGKHHRDDAFYKHVETVLGIKVFYGQFKGTKPPIEKGVDVRLATDLIVDAFFNQYEQAYVYSSDTDLLPAIEAVHKRISSKRIIVCLNAGMKHLSQEFKKAGATPLLLTKNLLEQFEPKPVVPSAGALMALQEKFGKKV